VILPFVLVHNAPNISFPALSSPQLTPGINAAQAASHRSAQLTFSHVYKSCHVANLYASLISQVTGAF